MAMTVTFIQTADAFNYKPMLDITSKTVIEYCRRHGHSYESYVGIKRGLHPWQASFNRLFMLKDLMDAGHRGWVVHMDADAFIYDLGFDLNAYLADKGDRAGVLTPIGGGRDWEINNGVMLINLGHPIGRWVVEAWHKRYMDVSDDTLRQLVEWPGDINDQTFLFELLDQHEEVRSAFFYQDKRLLNDPYGEFIRQILRAFMPAQSDRLEVVRTAVDEIMPGEGDDVVTRLFPLIMSNLFRILLHRDVDAGALANYRPRFIEKGIDTAFRETFAEILVSREYLELHPPVPPHLTIRMGYKWILGRDGDEDGLSAYTEAFKSGAMSIEDIRRDMIRSDEFTSSYPTLTRRE
jgi:hypothetical protein